MHSSLNIISEDTITGQYIGRCVTFPHFHTSKSRGGQNVENQVGNYSIVDRHV